LGLRGRFRGKQISSQPSFGLANSQVEIISSRIAQVPGTNNGQKATVVLTIQILPIGVIMSRQNSYRSRTHFTARSPTTTKHILVTGQKRLVLFRGFKRRTKVRLFPLAR